MGFTTILYLESRSIVWSSPEEILFFFWTSESASSFSVNLPAAECDKTQPKSEWEKKSFPVFPRWLTAQEGQKNAMRCDGECGRRRMENRVQEGWILARKHYSKNKINIHSYSSKLADNLTPESCLYEIYKTMPEMVLTMFIFPSLFTTRVGSKRLNA